MTFVAGHIALASPCVHGPAQLLAYVHVDLLAPKWACHQGASIDTPIFLKIYHQSVTKNFNVKINFAIKRTQEFGDKS